MAKERKPRQILGARPIEKEEEMPKENMGGYD
jgi:hypothetical protein